MKQNKYLADRIDEIIANINTLLLKMSFNLLYYCKYRAIDNLYVISTSKKVQLTALTDEQAFHYLYGVEEALAALYAERVKP